MGLDWLRSSLICNGRTVRPALIPEEISDTDIPDVCLRMHLILDTIEYARGEGRLISTDIFDPIDTLASEIQRHSEIRLSEWRSTIEQFGRYYQLSGTRPIEVAQRSVDQLEYLGKSFGVEIADF